MIREAAGLVPVFPGHHGDPVVVLVRRTDGGEYGGQLAFPGGKPEPGDGSMLGTALRETREEIGLSRERIEILEHLPAAVTLTSGITVFPFLARVSPLDPWPCCAREIAEVLEVPVADLTRAGARGQLHARVPDSPELRVFPLYHVGAHRLWGLSYRILEPLIPRLLAGEWEV